MAIRLMFTILASVLLVIILASGQWVRPDWAQNWLALANNLPFEPGLRALIAGAGSRIVFVTPTLFAFISVLMIRQFLQHLGRSFRR